MERWLIKTGLMLAAMLCIAVTGFFRGGETVHSQGRSPSPSSDEKTRPAFALLAGITNYKSEKITPIDGCENNVSALAETLIRDYAFREEDVVTLVNEQATREAIMSGFRSHLIEKANKAKEQNTEAAIVFYFCGHGSQYPDQDGDENDGLDETFVVYDSRTGGVFDILDDELDDLKAELRPLTTNVTLILESCHSGTGTRESDGEFVSQETDADTRNRPPYKRRFPPTSPSDAHTYTEIAASLSYITAKSETAKYCNCDRPMSLMTKALVQALKRATHSTTYRSLMREVSAEVATRSRQEPQVEGNRDAVLFGGAAKRSEPYIEIERLLADGQIIIRAGTIHGLKEGSQVAVYASDSRTNSGSDGWLANGVVTRVGNASSVVQLPKASGDQTASAMRITSRVVLASPVFGGGPIIADLGIAESRVSDDNAVSLQKKIETSLEKERLIEGGMVSLGAATATQSTGGAIKLRRGKIGDIFPEISLMTPLLPATICDGNTLKTLSPAERYPDGAKEVYYLTAGADTAPLYGRTFDPADEAVAEKIAGLIRDHAYGQNLRSLDNAASTLPTQIQVTLNTIPGDAITEGCKDGRKTFAPNKEKFKGFQKLSDDKLGIGSFFQLNIKNISGELRRKADEFASGESYHIAVLALTNQGEIRNIYGSTGANEALQDGKEISVTLRTTEPIGIERLVIVVSKDHFDLSFYETRGVRRNAQSALERLLTNSGSRTRDSRTVVDAPDRWGVRHIELKVVEER